MNEILNMGWPFATVLIAAIVGGVVVWVAKHSNQEEAGRDRY